MGKIIWAVTRFLVAFFVLTGLMAFLAAAINSDPSAAVSGVIALTPWLALRYRDPTKTTLPFQARLERLVSQTDPS